MESIWQASAEDGRKHKKLVGDVQTDVLVIGGGMAGILTAYQLQQKGVRCIVVEADEAGGGTTGHTTGKVTAQHGLCYADLIRKFGAERAKQYYAANSEAIDDYRQLAQEFPCDLETKSAYVYTRNSVEKLKEELTAYERLGIEGEYVERLPLPFATAGAVKMPDQAQFHPLKLLFGLAKNLDVYEHSPIREIKDGKAYGEMGTVTAERIVLATHYPLVNVPGLYFMKLYQDRSYVLALKNGPQLDGMYLDAEEGGFSFRNYESYLLLGGGGGRTGNGGCCWQPVKNLAAEAYAETEPAYAWAAQDCMSLDGVPYVGVHRSSAPDLYVATGFNKWGMTGSMAAATALVELIRDGHCRYETLFSPRRPMFGKQLFVNLGTAAARLLHFGKRCSHLGCALVWNADERSWDCPCHGSRFDGEGEILNNPAKERIKQ